MLAFEMARQLSHLGETVDYLAIIDTGPCWSGQTMKPRDHLAWSAAVLRNVPGWIHCEWKHTPWSIIVSSVKRKSRYAFRWMSSFGHAETTFDDVFESPRIASRDTSIMRLCFEAFTSYTSDMTAVSIAEQARYAGNVHLFRTRTQSLMSGAQSDLGWSRWANHVSVHLLPGNHEMVFSSPSVEVLAREIDRGLRLLNQGDDFLHSSH
jgi:thioesterase domain-containing protein